MQARFLSLIQLTIKCLRVLDKSHLLHYHHCYHVHMRKVDVIFRVRCATFFSNVCERMFLGIPGLSQPVAWTSPPKRSPPRRFDYSVIDCVWASTQDCLIMFRHAHKIAWLAAVFSLFSCCATIAWEGQFLFLPGCRLTKTFICKYWEFISTLRFPPFGFETHDLRGNCLCVSLCAWKNPWIQIRFIPFHSFFQQ